MINTRFCNTGVCLFFLFPFSSVCEWALPALMSFVPAASNAACTHCGLCLDLLWIVVWTGSSIKTSYYLSVKSWCPGRRPSRRLLSEKQASPRMFPFLFKWSLLRWVWIISVCILERVHFILNCRNGWDLKERMRMKVVLNILGSKIPVRDDSFVFTNVL